MQKSCFCSKPSTPTVFSVISAPSKMIVFFRAFGPMRDLLFLPVFRQGSDELLSGHNRIRWFLYLTP